MKVTLSDGTAFTCDLSIVQIGFLFAKEVFEEHKVRLNDDGSIAIDPYFETSRCGIFAVGDVHGDIKQVTAAWAEGIQDAIYAFKEITAPIGSIKNPSGTTRWRSSERRSRWPRETRQLSLKKV